MVFVSSPCSFLKFVRIAILSTLIPFLLPGSQNAGAQTQPAAGATGGQGPAAKANSVSPGSSSLSTDIDEVSLDLTVRTKHKKPVLDLQPSQLTITDAGSPVQLTSLHLVSAETGSEHLVTLLFDRFSPIAAKRARETAEKIVGVFPQKGFSFAVLQVNGRLRLLQAYTQDRGVLDAAIADATPDTPAAPSGEMTPAEKALIGGSGPGYSDALGADRRAEGKLILSALEESQRIIEERHGSRSLAALQGLVLSDRLLTGRKFILYFSEGMPESSDTHDALQSILGLANRAGVTICVVDTNLVDEEKKSAMQASQVSSLLGGSNGGSPTSSFGVGGLPGNSGGKSFENGNDALDAVHNISGFQFGDYDSVDSPFLPLTTGTGGIYIGASGGYNRQLQQLQGDLTSWYQASWTPPIKKYTGEFRPISIHTSRKDLVIRARSGYFAVEPTEATGVRPFEMPLLNVLAGSTFPTDIAFKAGVLHLGELPDGNASELTVQVPISQLAVREDANTHVSSVHASIVAVIKDSKGTAVERFGEDFPLHESPDKLRADSGQTITLEKHFSAEPGVYTLQAAVMDRNSNKLGAESTTFTIEPAPKGPSLSEVALVESVKPIEEESEAFEPMRFGDGQVVPNLTGTLPADTKSLSLFFLVHPIAGSQTQPTLHMQIFRNGNMLAELPMDLDKVSGTGSTIPYLGTIHGRAFAPGEYQVKAVLSQDGGSASSSVSFRVEGDAATANAADAELSAGGASGAGGINSKEVSEASTANSQFVISSPKDPVPPPTDAEIQAMIEGTRQRAMTWSDSLVNFYCYEVTNHAVDETGTGDWKHKDTLVQLMQYVDHEESRTTMMLNGDRSDVQPDQLQFAHSAGEFGAMFHIVFNPSAKAVFTWKRKAFIDGQPVEVFEVKVARADSGYDLYDRDGHVAHAGFHGLVYLDPATLTVRRISIDADDIPPTLLIRASSMSIDYEWVSMEGNDFLLPVRGAVSLQEAGRHPVLNEFTFVGYKRFGSKFRLLTNPQSKTDQPSAAAK